MGKSQSNSRRTPGAGTGGTRGDTQAPGAAPNVNVEVPPVEIDVPLEQRVPEVRPTPKPEPVAQPIVRPVEKAPEPQQRVNRIESIMEAAKAPKATVMSREEILSKVPEVRETGKERVYSGTVAAPTEGTAKGAAAPFIPIPDQNISVNQDTGEVALSDEDFLDTLKGRNKDTFTPEETQRALGMEPAVIADWKAKRTTKTEAVPKPQPQRPEGPVPDQRHKDIKLQYDIAQVAGVAPDAPRSTPSKTRRGNERIFKTWEDSVNAYLAETTEKLTRADVQPVTDYILMNITTKIRNENTEEFKTGLKVWQGFTLTSDPKAFTVDEIAQMLVDEGILSEGSTGYTLLEVLEAERNADGGEYKQTADSLPLSAIMDILEGRVNAALDASDVKAAEAHLAVLNQWADEVEKAPDVPAWLDGDRWNQTGQELPRPRPDIDLAAAKAFDRGYGTKETIERARERINTEAREETKKLIQQGYDAVDDSMFAARRDLGLDVDETSPAAVRAAQTEAEEENLFGDEIGEMIAEVDFDAWMSDKAAQLQNVIDAEADAERAKLEAEIDEIRRIASEKPDTDAPKPQSILRKHIIEAMAFIRENLVEGFFPLSGDTMVEEAYEEIDDDGNAIPKTRMVPANSEAVRAEITKTLQFLGIEQSKFADKMLFRAFQLYRGMSIDHQGKLFKQAKNDIAISDEVFIQFLHEIRNNIRTHNHPFAYTNPHYELGGTECYPVIISKQLAQWFSSGTSGELDLSAEDILAYSIDQHNNIVGPRMDKLASWDQREVLHSMRDVIANDLNDPRIPKRSVDERVAASELLDADSEYAKLFNNETALVEAMQERQERQLRAMARIEKKKGRAKKNDLTADDVGEMSDEWWYEVSAPNAQSAARTVANIGRVMGVIGNPFIAATGMAEKTTGVLYQSAGTWFLRNFIGGTQTLSAEGKALIGEDHNIEAMEEMLKILAAEGFDGLIDLAAKGAIFTKGAGKTNVKNENKKMTRVRTRTGQWVEIAMAWSTGDVVFKKKTARILLDHLAYQFENTALKNPGATTFTAAQLESMLASDPNDFWRMVAQTPEGRAALLYAGNTSLAGVDPITNMLRLHTQNAIVDASLGFIIGWYLKFGIRSAIRMIPYSNTAIYLSKRGLINPMVEGMGLRDTASIGDTNEFMLGGNEDFGAGLAQNIIVDTMRFGTQAATFAFCLGLVTLLGGIQPPDEDEKRHLWYEWKIMGKAVKEAWYFQELLGFSMPLVVAVLAGAQTGDTDEAMFILTNGVWEKLEQNPWTNAADLIDLVNNFDPMLVEAQARSEGYEGGEVGGGEFAASQFLTWMTRRTYQTLEPAILRQAYNDHGLFTGTDDLARSNNMVWTGDPDDPTTMTTWLDSQMRSAVEPSRFAGFLANIISGYYWQDNEEDPLTGYMESQKPLVTNVDSTNQMWIDNLSVKDADGKFVPADKWTPEQTKRIVNEVKKLLREFPVASDMAAQGIVIPFDARAATINALNEQWGEIRSAHYKRVADGDFSEEKNGLPYLVNRKRQNKAYEKHLKEQAKVQAKIDALFSDEIPYSALKYNRWETNYRTMYVWKDGENAGKPTHPLNYRLYPSRVEIVRYASGDHKSSFAPYLTVDDQGENTYDAQTQVGWQTGATDLDYVKRSTEGKILQSGVNKGMDAWDVLSGEGGAYAKAIEGGPLVPKLLTGSRALMPERLPYEKLDPKDFKKPKIESVSEPKDGRRVSWGRGGWGGGGKYVPAIYSHPAYSLNADKPAGLYSKTPQYTRFDYLRPKVATKGSREAYRREDF